MDIDYYLNAPITLLNSDTLSDVLVMCRKYPRYRACVVFDSSGNYIPFMNEIMHENATSPIPGVHFIRFYNTDGVIEFENGSIIDMFILKNNCRGKRFNSILYTRGIEDNTLFSILFPMRIRYDYSTIVNSEVNNKENDVQSFENDESSLDDFLKSFVIKT